LDRRLSLIEPPKKAPLGRNLELGKVHRREQASLRAVGGTGSIPAEITGTVKVTDISGTAQQLQALQITLSDSPIFVEIKS
jgi:hypothetical protein